MPTYQFTGITVQNEPASGSVDADDSKRAREMLLARGIRSETLILQEVVLEIDEDAPRSPSGQLSSAKALNLTTHLAELLKANLPLAPGLRAMAQELPDRQLAKTFHDLAVQLESGAPLDAALESTAERLPPYVRGLLGASLRSGRYQEALEDFLDNERAASASRYRLWLTVSYTLFLFGLIICWFLFIIFFLIPPFAGIYKDFKVSLPHATQFLVKLADARMGILAATISIVVTLVVVVRLAGRISPFSRILDHIPLIGPVWRYGALARFSNLLAVLLEQGVPLPAALEFTASGVDHAAIAQACRRAAKVTSEGRGLVNSIADLPQFPAVLVPMLAWGERLSAVPEALRTAASMFRQRVEQRAPLAAIVLPAFGFLAIVLAVFFVVVALFMPLVKLVTTLS